MKGLTDKKKIAQLLCNSIGSEHYNNLSAFLGPDKPLKSLDYETLLNDFKKLLTPKKSVVVAQHYFLNIFQKENQSISEFVADLRRDLQECEFAVECSNDECGTPVSIADVFLRAQFIRGLKDNWLREHLLQSVYTKFDDILEKAIALEASKVESKEFHQHACSNNFNMDSAGVHKITRSSRRSHQFSNNRSSNKTSLNWKQRSNNKRPEFNALGIEGLCLRCGSNKHIAANCNRHKYKLQCGECLKRGHVSAVCITTLMSRTKKSTSKLNSTNNLHSGSNDDDYSSDDSSDYGVHKIDSIYQNFDVVDLFEVGYDSDKYIVSVTINGKLQCFEVDSGAKFSLLAKNDFERLHLNVPVEPSRLAFRSYSGDIIKPEGKVSVSVSYKGKQFKGDLHIVPSGHDALLGRQWIRGLGIELCEIDAEMNRPATTLQLQPVNSVEELFEKFAPIFEPKIGCVPNFTVSLHLRSGAKPIFNRERNVPHALIDQVNKELDLLENEGIISPVTSSDWGSPLVVIPKADGSVRLCVDYKCGVNERIVQANHPIRKIDDVLDSLRGSRYFCKLDLYKAYLHLKVDEESSIIQTMSTHRGTYRVNRLSFGIKTAPSEFNRILTQILKGLPKTEAYFDDIICHGSTMDECKRNLQACLQRLSDFDLHINKQKC
ncbi:uncharacterized protein K02A2.6-like [Macrosteles quadrilineatus]|uniref:uncharacterized protein K02A2.6-like n=1 Tax=Macrosteles quadrilineatus TaxID=74068 RepID=UPI0023E31419|nr:uncharacterized protein K02A2.6-like [Macrosteles quadrilineatus]